MEYVKAQTETEQKQRLAIHHAYANLTLLAANLADDIKKYVDQEKFEFAHELKMQREGVVRSMEVVRVSLDVIMQSALRPAAGEKKPQEAAAHFDRAAIFKWMVAEFGGRPIRRDDYRDNYQLAEKCLTPRMAVSAILGKFGLKCLAEIDPAGSMVISYKDEPFIIIGRGIA